MRLFIGLMVPAHVDAAIDAAFDAGYRRRAAAHGVADRWTAPGERHLTLRFMGEVENPGAVVDAMREVARAGPAPTLRVAGTATLLTASALVLPVAGADALATRVARALAPDEDPPPFTGHVTVARAARRLRRAAGPRIVPPHAPLEVAWRSATLDTIATATAPPRYRTIAAAAFRP